MSGEAEYFHIACYLGVLDINLLKVHVNVLGKLKIIRFLKLIPRLSVIPAVVQLVSS